MALRRCASVSAWRSPGSSSGSDAPSGCASELLRGDFDWVDRSVQTDARAKPVRPDGGTASGALGSRRVKVGVVGLGTMGAGIAQVSVTAGHDTVGREVTDELAERGRATIDRYLTRGVEKGRMTQVERDAALGRLTLTTEFAHLAD